MKKRMEAQNHVLLSYRTVRSPTVCSSWLKSSGSGDSACMAATSRLDPKAATKNRAIICAPHARSHPRGQSLHKHALSASLYIYKVMLEQNS